MTSILNARESGHAMRTPNTVDEEPAAQVLETLRPRSMIRSDTILLLRACVTFIAVHKDHLHGVTERRFARPHGHSLLGQQECNRISAGWWYCVSGLRREKSGRQPAPDIGGPTIREKRRAGLACPNWERIGWANNSKSNDKRDEGRTGPKGTRSSSRIIAGWTCLKGKGFDRGPAKLGLRLSLGTVSR